MILPSIAGVATWAPQHREYLKIRDQVRLRPFRDQAIVNLFRKQLGQ